MLGIRGKPSKELSCQLDLLTVLVCPITFPSPSTLLRALSATQGQVAESASGLAGRVAGRVAESASGLAERVGQVSQAGVALLNADDGSTGEVSTEPPELSTTHSIQDTDLTAYDWMTYGGRAIILSVVILTLGYKLYGLLTSERRTHQSRPQSIEPDILLPDAVPCSPPSGFYSGGRLRPMPLLPSSAMPRPSAPPAARDSPPPYEAPPPYDSNWRG
eukprot:Blabericola_migrator_1__3358@NODE_1993_length_3449_cov_51_658782_g1269_i0_p2_GENE_NODE_1993_length_3449_cov_51_658782_g1269_i0NODE_1993_length_3449_cov_51_658782_g1269_i0_p2_ORF_typecomplete_len218_score21_11Apolipoprotein/PF01442_18/0_083_NODE_1993_length_3449_cov_51_658782_g1269_i022842937